MVNCMKVAIVPYCFICLQFKTARIVVVGAICLLQCYTIGLKVINFSVEKFQAHSVLKKDERKVISVFKNGLNTTTEALRMENSEGTSPSYDQDMY